jgi:hypothetical protein
LKFQLFNFPSIHLFNYWNLKYPTPRLADHTHKHAYPQKQPSAEPVAVTQRHPITDDTTKPDLLRQTSYCIVPSNTSVVMQSNYNTNYCRPHPHAVLRLLVTSLALTLTQPSAPWSLVTPSPSRSVAPTGHSFRPHPHAALRLLVSPFALTLTQCSAYWSLLSPSPSRSLAPSRESFRPHPHAV